LFDGHGYQKCQPKEYEEERENGIFEKMSSQEEINQILETRFLVNRRHKNNPLQDHPRLPKPSKKDNQIARIIIPNTEVP